MTPVFIINFKNYPEGLGSRAIELARIAEEVSREVNVEMIVAPSTPMLGTVCTSVTLPVFAQKADDMETGKSTGAVVPESLVSAGCSGSLLNHSESRIPMASIQTLVVRMKSLGLKACVCAETSKELREAAGFGPEYVAIEPPALIGSGVSVSKTRPDLILDSTRTARDVQYTGRVLCGAGIVDRDDARKAMDLGSDGILVASSVLRSPDPRKKIEELASAIVS